MVGLMILLGTGQMARPNTSLQPRTDINPGLLYWQAFGVLPKLEEADREKIDGFTEQLARWSSGSAAAPTVELPADVTSIVTHYERSLRLLDKARVSSAPCDWGADPADGPDMLIPDTRGLRELTKISLLKAAVQLESGNADDSVDTLMSVLALARHSAQDQTLVSVMLQQRVESQFVDYIGAKLGGYPAPALARLREGLRQIPPRVPLLLGVESEANFQRWMIDQVHRQLQRYPGDSHKAYAASRGILVELFASDKQQSQKAIAALDAASGSTAEGLVKLLDELEPFYQDARTLATAGPDTIDQTTSALEQRIKTSGNPIAAASLPNFGRARTRELAHLARWAMMEASLAQALGGEAALLAVPDPLSGKPFLVKAVEEGVVELRSEASLGAEVNPVLRVRQILTRER
jgi:hypothetical protein